MKNLCAWVLGFFLMGNLAGAVVPAASPDDTVRAFYSYRIKSALTGAPTAQQLAVLRQWFTPRLWTQLEKAGKERDVFIKKYGNDEKPPWCEGDIFSSTFEGPTSFEIGGGAGDGEQSMIQVLFAYRQPGQKTVRWADRILLKKIQGKWLIDDVIYDLPVEFGNHSTLRANLP
jgi:hypothetical protein